MKNDLFTLIRELLELEDAVYWANLYGRIYKQATSLRTIESMLSELEKKEPQLERLKEKFKTDFPELDLQTELAFYSFAKSGLFKDGAKCLFLNRTELGLNSVEAIEKLRAKCTIRAFK